MKVRTRAADGPQVADCGHRVAAGHAVVRRGRRWVCTACSLPGGTLWNLPPCDGCGMRMGLGARIALGVNGHWNHRECYADRPLALVTVTDGSQAGF